VNFYSRKHPEFSLCGLNCSLCPRFHVAGVSRCPGCGGKDFFLKHPSCGVITCSRKNGTIEYCFECRLYPCQKYSSTSEKDSFITYRKVAVDMAKAKNNLADYLGELKKKEALLAYLLEKYDNGRMKNYYCLAVNLLEPEDISTMLNDIRRKDESDSDDVIKEIKRRIEERAKERAVEIRLRK